MALNKNYAGKFIHIYTPTIDKYTKAICTWKNNCILLSVIISDYESTKLFKQGIIMYVGWIMCNMQEQFLTVLHLCGMFYIFYLKCN